MAAQRVVLIDERDRQLGTCDVAPACQAIAHDGAVFIRMPETVRLKGRAASPAIVFREFEPWRRDRLTPI